MKRRMYSGMPEKLYGDNYMIDHVIWESLEKTEDLLLNAQWRAKEDLFGLDKTDAGSFESAIYHIKKDVGEI